MLFVMRLGKPVPVGRRIPSVPPLFTTASLRPSPSQSMNKITGLFAASGMGIATSIEPSQFERYTVATLSQRSVQRSSLKLIVVPAFEPGNQVALGAITYWLPSEISIVEIGS